MAAPSTTGMEKAAMHKMLTEAKKEPVNCAIGTGKDQGIGLLIMHRMKAGRALDKQMTDEMPDAKNTRWGTVKIDDDDAKQANFYLNRPITGMARKLVKTLKGTGFSKVKIMLDDGTAVENAADDEEDAPGAAPAQASAEAPAQPSSGAPAAPPPPPAQPAAQAAPDAGELAKRLAALAPRIPQVAGEDGNRKAELLKLATQVNVNIKTNNLTYAATYLEQLAKALEAAPPAPPPPPPQAPAQDASALGKQLAALIPRVAAITDPARKAELGKLATMANVNIKTNNLTYAATSIAQLARGLDEGAAPTPPKAKDPATFTRPGRDWLAARQSVEDEMETLRATIMGTYEGQPMAADIDRSFRQRIAPVMRTLDASLAVKLNAASKADSAGQPALVEEARTILANYEKFAADPLLADLDDNPFVPLSIRANLTATLSQISAALA